MFLLPLVLAKEVLGFLGMRVHIWGGTGFDDPFLAIDFLQYTLTLRPETFAH